MLAPMVMTNTTPLPDLPYVCQTRGDQDMVELALANGLTPKAAEAIAAIDAVMHKVRRSMQRRDFGHKLIARIATDLDIGHFDTINAIAHSPAWSDDAHEEVTVGLIAERLGIDPSRASRLAADVVDRGYARRVASQTDARRICLELTPKGELFVETVRRNKWEVFAGALGEWSDQELTVFAALLERFAGWATDEGRIDRSAEKIKRALEHADDR